MEEIVRKLRAALELLESIDGEKFRFHTTEATALINAEVEIQRVLAGLDRRKKEQADAEGRKLGQKSGD